MPFLALPQMVVYILPCLIPFQCASAPGKKRKRKRGERGRKRERKRGGEKKRYWCRFDPPPPPDGEYFTSTSQKKTHKQSLFSLWKLLLRVKRE